MYKCSNCCRTDVEPRRICPRCHKENSYVNNDRTIESSSLSLENMFEEEEEEYDDYDDEDLEL